MTGSRIGTLICAFLLTAVSNQAQGELELVDEVVATVDKEVILYSEIVSVIGSELKNIQETSTTQSDYDRRTNILIRDALEEAIESRILLDEARKLSVQVPDEDVEERISELRDSYDNEEEFLAALRDAGESLSDLREKTRNQIMARYSAQSKLMALEEEIVVSEDSILQYYQDNMDEYERPERVRVRQIFLLSRPSTDERERALARLEELRIEIEAGADFAELAKLHSQAPGADKGGIIGWQERGDLVPVLDEPAFSLQVGVTSEVLQTAGGVHLLRVDEHQEVSHATFEEVRLTIEPEIRTKLAEDRYYKWLGDLRGRSRVRIFL